MQASTTPTASTDLTLSGIVSGTAYYDGSYVAAVRVVTGTTTNATTLKTDRVSIAFVTPFFASANNQQFYVGQATTTLATLTITESGNAPVITAANDIRITIATTTTNFIFNTTTTSLTFGGTAASKVANPVSYADNGATLVIPVSSDFAVADTLTIDGIQAGSFATVSTTTSRLTLQVDGNATGTAVATDVQTIRITGSLTLANHSDGQVTNQFVFLNSTDIPLFGFALTPASENATVTALTIPLSTVHNIDASKLTNLRLYRDYDGSQTLSAGDGAVGGTGVFVASGFAGTITFSDDFLSTTTNDFIVVSDLSDVSYSNMLTIGLPSSALMVTGVTSNYAPVFLGTVTEVAHRRGRVIETGGALGLGGPIGGATAQGTVRSGGSSRTSSAIEPTDPGDTIGAEVGFYAPTVTGTSHNEWTTGTNALASDGSYATAASDNLRQSYSTFNFNIPGSNTITGIAVKLEASGSTAAGTIDVVLSWDGDTSITSAQTTATLTGTDAVYTLGGQTNTWGQSWTPTYFTNGNFRVRVIAHPSSNTIRIDAIQVSPYHQATGGGGGLGGAI